MSRLFWLSCLGAAALLSVPARAVDSIAIYTGIAKISSVGGGNSNSSNGSSTGKRREPVYLAIDTTTGVVQRVTLNTRLKQFTVEDPTTFFQTSSQTDARRPRKFARLMLVKHSDLQEGGFTDVSSQYEGQALDSVITSAGLTVAYPRVLKWAYNFQYSGFEVAPPAVTTYAQIDTGSALFSLNRSITKAAVGKDLSSSIDVITGFLTARRYKAAK